MSTRNTLRSGIDGNAEHDNRGTVGHGAVDDAVGWQFSRYDLLLLRLPLPLALGLGWTAVTATPMSAGVGLGSVPTLGLLAYSLFGGVPASQATESAGSATRYRSRRVEADACRTNVSLTVRSASGRRRP